MDYIEREAIFQELQSEDTIKAALATLMRMKFPKLSEEEFASHYYVRWAYEWMWRQMWTYWEVENHEDDSKLEVAVIGALIVQGIITPHIHIEHFFSQGDINDDISRIHRLLNYRLYIQDDLDREINNLEEDISHAPQAEEILREGEEHLLSLEAYRKKQVQRGRISEKDDHEAFCHMPPFVFDDHIFCLFQPSIVTRSGTYRPDMVAWLPDKPHKRWIFEFDGHSFHSERKPFRADRIRDRALQFEGYRVLRYSGSEILSNSHAVMADLELIVLEELSKRRPRDGRSQEKEDGHHTVWW